MSQLSFDEDQESITMEANTLLTKLNKSYLLLQKLNEEIESRPFSTRIHGQFDHQLKKSQSIISKLSSLLRKYYSFELSSSVSLEMKEKDESSSNPIDTSFIIDFKDICLKIEREWRIGTKLIHDFESKYRRNHRQNDSQHYHSDTDTRYSNKHNKHKKKLHQRPRSHSPIHSFSNPIKAAQSRSQILQKQTFLKDKTYHTKIGSDFVPFDDEHRLNQQIRDINDDLQYLLEVNKQVNDLVMDQGQSVDDMERKVNDTKANIEQGMNTLTSIRKSPITYGIMGGIAMAALGAPIVLIGVGVKAAIGSSIGFGTVGAVTGSIYANKVNDGMDEEDKRDSKQRSLLQRNDKIDINNKGRGFQTIPRKRVNRVNTYDYNKMDDDEEDIDVWDARN